MDQNGTLLFEVALHEAEWDKSLQTRSSGEEAASTMPRKERCYRALGQGVVGLLAGKYVLDVENEQLTQATVETGE